MICPECSQKIPANSKFCSYCGAKIRSIRKVRPDSGIPSHSFPHKRTLRRTAKFQTSHFSQPGRFQILQKIGQGSMGVVYEARDKVLERVVALKRFYMDSKSTRLAIFRFLKNAFQIAELHHTHIVPVYDVGEDEEGPFISMELVQGENLFDASYHEGSMPEEEVLQFGRQICMALDFAHQKGIVHGAIKPSNIFIASEGMLKVADFGLSKIYSKHSTLGRGISPEEIYFIAPEQLQDSLNPLPTSDIFSFGKLLYYLVVGKEIEVNSTLVPHRLRRIILKSTDPKPHRRFPDMSALLGEIDLALKSTRRITKKIQKTESMPLLEGDESLRSLKRDEVSDTLRRLSSCGHYNTITSIFCGKCGKDLKIHCPLCGHEYSEFEEACPKCSRKEGHSSGELLDKGKILPPTSLNLRKDEWEALLEPSSSASGELQESIKDLDDYNFTQAFQKIKSALKQNRDTITDLAQSSPSSQPLSPSPSFSEDSGLANPSYPPSLEEVLASPPSSGSGSQQIPATSDPFSISSEEKLANEYAEMARAYLETFHFDKSIQFARKALSHFPNHREAQELLKEAAEKEKELNLSIEQAKKYEQASNIKMAYQTWSKVQNLMPFHPGIQKKVEILKKKLEQLDEQAKKAVEALTSQKTYEEFIEAQGPNLPADVKKKIIQSELQKGQSAILAGNFKKAKEAGKKILELDINNKKGQELIRKAQETLNTIARILEQADKLEQRKELVKAYEQWQKILSLTPNNEKVKKKLKELDQSIHKELDEKMIAIEGLFENREYRKVLLECQKILKSYPSHKMCQMLVQKSKEALKESESFLKKAQEAFRNQEWEKALEWAQKALDIDWKKQEAKELIRKAIAKVEEEGEKIAAEKEKELFYQKAKKAYEDHQWAEALEWAQKLIERDPLHQEGLEIIKNSIQKEKEELERIKLEKAQVEIEKLKQEQEALRREKEELKKEKVLIENAKKATEPLKKAHLSHDESTKHKEEENTYAYHQPPSIEEEGSGEEEGLAKGTQREDKHEEEDVSQKVSPSAVAVSPTDHDGEEVLPSHHQVSPTDFDITSSAGEGEVSQQVSPTAVAVSPTDHNMGGGESFEEKHLDHRETRKKEEKAVQPENNLKEEEEKASLELETFLNNALEKRNLQEPEIRKKHEIRAILESAKTLSEQQQWDLALQEIERGLGRHPGNEALQIEYENIQQKMQEFMSLNLQRKRATQETKAIPPSQLEEEAQKSLNPVDGQEKEEQSFQTSENAPSSLHGEEAMEALEMDDEEVKLLQTLDRAKKKEKSRKKSTKFRDKKNLAQYLQNIQKEEDELSLPLLSLAEEIGSQEKSGADERDLDLLPQLLSEKLLEDLKQIRKGRRSKLATETLGKSALLQEMDKMEKEKKKTLKNNPESRLKKKKLKEVLEDVEHEEVVAGMDTLSLDASDVEKLKSKTDFWRTYENEDENEDYD
ncbi:MAG: zinc-ribbon domain-containing protein [Planctomycetota bacterium]|nr:MAG: zinc-ribbon domain-containing protein [Planctomycetota bacterium]